MKTLVCLFLLALCCKPGLAAQAAGIGPEKPASRKEKGEGKKKDPALVPEFLWSGAWESRHNLVNRFDFTLTAPKPGMALRFEVLDRRPASSSKEFSGSFWGETKDKAITQPGLWLYHLSTGSRLLYGVLDTYGLEARIRNVWIRGAPFAQSRTESSADLKTAPSSTAVLQGYAYLGSNGISLGPGKIYGFASFAANDNSNDRAPALGAGLDYELGKKKFLLEGFYTERTLPERKSSTWFNVKPALPERDTRLFASSAAISIPAFGLAADLAYSETFAFGKDYYSSLALRFGDKPWRFSLVFDAAGSRYIDSAGNNPGAGFRTAARLERMGKKSGLFRLTALFRGPGPDEGLQQAVNEKDFFGIMQSFNRMSGELYYRFPSNSAFFGLTRFSLSVDRDARNEKKVLDSGQAMAAFKLGPVNSASEGKITSINAGKSAGTDKSGHIVNSYKLTQRFSLAAKLPASQKTGKKNPYSVLFSTKAGYEKIYDKEGNWDVSCSISLRGKKNRITIKTAASAFPQKWEYTVNWRLLF